MTGDTSKLPQGLLSSTVLMPPAPLAHIAISLTSSTFRFSDEDSAKPSIVVTTTLVTPAVLTVECRGARDAGTILSIAIPLPDLDFKFRVENFAFHDVSTSEPVVYDLYPGSCEPKPYFLELRASEPRVTRAELHENNPLTDPVYMLKPGHTYRVRLKPQTVQCWAGGTEELFARREVAKPPEGIETLPDDIQYTYPAGLDLTLACDDELILKVEE